MFKVYSVSYDLRTRTNPDYAGLEEELKKSSAWLHLLKSTWLIATTETPEQLLDRIALHTQQDDHLYICEVGKNGCGKLPNDAWMWIEAHVQSEYAVL